MVYLILFQHTRKRNLCIGILFEKFNPLEMASTPLALKSGVSFMLVVSSSTVHVVFQLELLNCQQGLKWDA